MYDSEPKELSLEETILHLEEELKVLSRQFSNLYNTYLGSLSQKDKLFSQLLQKIDLVSFTPRNPQESDLLPQTQIREKKTKLFFSQFIKNVVSHLSQDTDVMQLLERVIDPEELFTIGLLNVINTQENTFEIKKYGKLTSLLMSILGVQATAKPKDAIKLPGFHQLNTRETFDTLIKTIMNGGKVALLLHEIIHMLDKIELSRKKLFQSQMKRMLTEVHAFFATQLFFQANIETEESKETPGYKEGIDIFEKNLVHTLFFNYGFFNRKVVNKVINLVEKLYISGYSIPEVSEFIQTTHWDTQTQTFPELDQAINDMQKLESERISIENKRKHFDLIRRIRIEKIRIILIEEFVAAINPSS